MTAEAAERRQVLTYAPATRRDGVAALLALDDALSRIVRTTREPALGQMRLLWWREALAKLDTAPPLAEPVLSALAGHVLPHGVTGARLSDVLDGWDVLIEVETLDASALATYADGRGVRLFAAAGVMLGADARDPVEAAGRGWALADLARNLDRAGEAQAARDAAMPALAAACGARWSRKARVLGALAHAARMDLAEPAGAPPGPGGPGRVGRLLWHGLTGR